MMAPQSLVGARQVALCTVESPLLRPLEFLIPSQFGGESLQELCVCAHSVHLTLVFAEAERVQFCEELVAMAKRVHVEVRLPMIVAGDANVWHPYFNLGRSRSVDDMIVPFINLLISSCGLVFCNPRDRATPVRPLIWCVPHQVRH